MAIIQLLVLLALIGFGAWALTKLIPMPARIAQIIVIVAVAICILVVLVAFGLLPQGIPSVR